MSIILNLHELPRRSGEYKDYKLDLTLTEPMGVAMIAVQSGRALDISLTATSVDEGVLIRGQILALAEGQCSRCLDPVSEEINQSFDELFEYENKAAKLSKDDVDTDEILMVKDDCIDIETPVRDAIVLALEVNPLCSPDCLGLCPGCGERFENLPPDHGHELVDPRWSALSDLAKKLDGKA
jgi:uncharacterized protein